MDYILNSILDLYRLELRCLVESIHDDTIKVVEFYVEKQKFYVDLENNIYSSSTKNSDRIMGKLVGYLKNGTIYLGDVNTIKN